MMIIIIILSVLLLASISVTFMFWFRYKKSILNRKKLNGRYETYKEKYDLLRKRVEDFFQEPGTGKIGVIHFTSSYSNYPRGFVEIEEIKKAGDKVKVRILDVSPIQGTTEEQLVKKMNDWVDESNITWVDGWQMKKRGKTIEDILDDETKIEKEKEKGKDDNN